MQALCRNIDQIVTINIREWITTGEMQMTNKHIKTLLLHGDSKECKSKNKITFLSIKLQNIKYL